MDTSKASSKTIQLQAGLMDNSRLCPTVKAAQQRRTPKAFGAPFLIVLASLAKHAITFNPEKAVEP